MDGVPKGTVASRITDLQNLVSSFSNNRSYSPTSRHRENSRTGFGRRVSARFGKPASISSKPDEQQQIDAKHTYLGLASRRANHTEEHAMADGRTKWNRTSGLHGQLKPSGLGAMVQYEATSPWGFLLNSKMNGITRHKHSHQNICTFDKGDSLVQFDNLASIFVPPSLPVLNGAERNKRDDSWLSDQPDLWAQRTTSYQQRADSSGERISAETTSTMRRQSVRDLFHYHGIQRPAGLVSSENVAGRPEGNRTPLQKCADCESHLYDVEATTVSSVYYEDMWSHPKTEHSGGIDSENKRAEKVGMRCHRHQSVLSHRSSSGETQVLERLNYHVPETSRRSSLPGAVPKLRVEVATPRYETANSATTNIHSMKKAQLLTVAPEPVNVVTIPQFLAPDSTSLNHLLGILPVPARTGCHQDRSGHCFHHQKSYTSYSLRETSSCDAVTKSEPYRCRCVGCSAKYSGRAKYRENIINSQIGRGLPEEADGGNRAEARHQNDIAIHEDEDYLGDGRHRYDNHSSPHGDQDFFLPERINISRNTFPTYGNVKEVLHNGYGKNASASHTVIEPSKQTLDVLDRLGQQDYERAPVKNMPSSPGFEDPHRGQQTEYSHHSIPPSSHASGFKELCRDCETPISCGGRHDACSYRYGGQTSSLNYYSAARKNYAGPTKVLSRAMDQLLAPKHPPRMLFSGPSENSKTPTIVPVSQSKRNAPAVNSPHILCPEPSANREQHSPKGSFMALKDLFERKKPSSPQLSVTKMFSNQAQHQTHPSPIEGLDTSRNSPSRASEKRGDEASGSNAEDPILGPLLESGPSQSTCPSGASSPSKSKPKSRRLSAFFKLQERNIVSVLNKRLQEHQEELKRIEKMCDGQLNDSARRKSVTSREDVDVTRPKKQELGARDEKATEKYQTPLKNSFEGRGEVQEDKSISEHKRRRDVMLSKPTSMEMDENAEEIQGDTETVCKWKELAIDSLDSILDSPGRQEEEHNAGICGITIIIHLEGREDVVIKADMSPNS